MEEIRAASPQGDWLASDGEVSCVESDEDSWDKESFTSSSDISESDGISRFCLTRQAAPPPAPPPMSAVC